VRTYACADARGTGLKATSWERVSGRSLFLQSVHKVTLDLHEHLAITTITSPRRSVVLLAVLLLVRECASASPLATIFELKMKLAISSQVTFAVGVSAFFTIHAIPCLVMLAQRRLVPLQVLVTMSERAVLGLLVIARASQVVFTYAFLPVLRCVPLHYFSTTCRCLAYAA
jgi:hypothetical protein